MLKDIQNHSARVQTIPDLTDSTFSLPQHLEQTNVSASQRWPQSQGRYMEPNFRHVYVLVPSHVSSYKERHFYLLRYIPTVLHVLFSQMKIMFLLDVLFSPVIASQV